MECLILETAPSPQHTKRQPREKIAHWKRPMQAKKSPPIYFRIWSRRAEWNLFSILIWYCFEFEVIHVPKIFKVITYFTICTIPYVRTALIPQADREITPRVNGFHATNVYVGELSWWLLEFCDDVTRTLRALSLDLNSNPSQVFLIDFKNRGRVSRGYCN